MQRIDDARIGAINVKQERQQSKVSPPVTIITDQDLMPVKYLLEGVTWGHLPMFSEQMAGGIGFHSEDGEILFSGAPDIESDIEPFDGVLFMDFFGNQVVMSKAAFWRLMDHFFTVLIDIANERELDVRNDSRWPMFLQYAERMRELAGQVL
jgi:hypothetical protein